MSQHDQTVYVRHMLDAARKALGYTLGKTKQDLLINELLSLAIVQLLQILGEAARRTSAEYRATTPQIPWRQIIGTRDRLAHGYDQVNYDTVWTILTDELPSLIAKLEKLVPPDAAP